MNLDILFQHLRSEPEPTVVSRRALLGAAGASAALPLLVPGAAQAAPAVGGRLESRLLKIDDPVEKLKAEMRVYRDLADDADVLLWYHWTAFIVAEGRTVAPLVRFEGIEFSHHRKVGENLYRAHGHNLSYPRDLTTNEYIERIRNPVTGKDIAIPPTVLLEDPGMLYSPAGKRPLNRKSQEFTPRHSVFRIEGDHVKVEEIRVPPDNWVTPFIESSHNWSPRAAFEDPKVLRLPMETAGLYVFPFPKWLEMGDVKGHMVGFWSGRKLDGAHQLPIDFYTRTENWRPELLKVDLRKFDT
jgi:hypothetical protein